MNREPINKIILEFDVMEADPAFALFIKAIYKDAMDHPEKLWTSAEIWDGVEELLEGVDLGEDED